MATAIKKKTTVVGHCGRRAGARASALSGLLSTNAMYWRGEHPRAKRFEVECRGAAPAPVSLQDISCSKRSRERKSVSIQATETKCCDDSSRLHTHTAVRKLNQILLQDTYARLRNMDLLRRAMRRVATVESRDCQGEGSVQEDEIHRHIETQRN